MNLYDTPSDVVRKAITGLGLTPAGVASQAGMEIRELMGFLNGSFSEESARCLAPVLELNPDALCELPNYRPELPELKGIRQIPMPFEDEEVNIWLVESEGTILAIDCGFRPNDFTQLIEPLRDQSIHLLITHAHRDHVGGLTSAAKEHLSSIHAPKGFGGSEAIDAGTTLEIGPFRIRPFDLSGHHPEALGYHILGSGIEVFAVGDAIFAGSMGGCPDSEAFALARRTVESAFSETNPDAILLPGHGPATTLGQELRSNPFLASWLS